MNFRNFLIGSLFVSFTTGCAVVNRFGPQGTVPTYTKLLVQVPDYIPEPLVLPAGAPPRLLSRIAVHDSTDTPLPLEESAVRVSEGSELVLHIYVQRPEELDDVGIDSAFTDLFTTVPRKLQFLQPKTSHTFNSAVSEVGFGPNLSHVGGGTPIKPTHEVKLFSVRAQVKGRSGDTFDVRTGSDSRWAKKYPIFYSVGESPTGIEPSSLTIRVE